MSGYASTTHATTPTEIQLVPWDEAKADATGHIREMMNRFEDERKTFFRNKSHLVSPIRLLESDYLLIAYPVWDSSHNNILAWGGFLTDSHCKHTLLRHNSDTLEEVAAELTDAVEELSDERVVL